MWCQAAMDFVVEEDLKAHLTCWYIQKYVKENPQPQYFEHIYQWPHVATLKRLSGGKHWVNPGDLAQKKTMWELNIWSFTSITMRGLRAGSEQNGIKEPKGGPCPVQGKFSSLTQRRCSVCKQDPVSQLVDAPHWSRASSRPAWCGGGSTCTQMALTFFFIIAPFFILFSSFRYHLL